MSTVRAGKETSPEYRPVSVKKGHREHDRRSESSMGVEERERAQRERTENAAVSGAVA